MLSDIVEEPSDRKAYSGPSIKVVKHEEGKENTSRSRQHAANDHGNTSDEDDEEQVISMLSYSIFIKLYPKFLSE